MKNKRFEHVYTLRFTGSTTNDFATGLFEDLILSIVHSWNGTHSGTKVGWLKEIIK